MTLLILQPLYTTFDSVKVRLVNKVQFQDGEEVESGEMPKQFLAQMIVDAETQVELELRSRYAIPFRSIAFGNFDKLPDHTKRLIRQVVDLKSVLDILSTDFGRGAHVSGDAYYKDVKDRYEHLLVQLLGRDRIAASDKIDRYKLSPPLDDLKLAVTNEMADNGYRGTIINTDASTNDAEAFAVLSINNPAEFYMRTRGPGGL